MWGERVAIVSFYMTFAGIISMRILKRELQVGRNPPKSLYRLEAANLDTDALDIIIPDPYINFVSSRAILSAVHIPKGEFQLRMNSANPARGRIL